MATITGARGTGNISASVRKIDMREGISLLEPDAAPLTQLSAKLRKRPTHNPEYSWQEDALEVRFDLTNGAVAGTTATSVVVDNGANFAEHDMIRVTRTKENMRVTAVAGNTLTVVRGVGSTAAALNDNEELLNIGSGQPEGDTSKPARSSNPTKYTNYTQIIRTPWESTETLIHSDTFTTPTDWDYQAKKKGIEHKKDLEYVFLLGTPSENTTGSQPRRTSGGAYHYATANQTDAGGALTETELWAALRPAYRYGSKTKVAFCSPLAISVLQTYPAGKLQVNQSETTYGLKVMNFASPFGVMRIIPHWLLEGTTLGGHILILDMDQITQRPLANEKGSRDTHIRTEIQAPDADTRKDEYLTETGLEFGSAQAHGLIYNITS